MKLVEETGIEVEWIIAHELPPKPINWPEISGEDWEILGQVLLVVAGIAIVIMVAPLLILGLMACSSNDPAIIAKVHNSKGEEVWLDLYRWY